MDFGIFSSEYERKARLYPAFLLLLPAVVTGVAAAAPKVGLLKSVLGGLLSCGVTVLLAQLARDAGYSRQPILFRLWGGIPSTSIFRHRNSRLDAITKGRYHQKLSELVPETRPAPTLAREEEQPEEADGKYAAWATFLRVNTRDTKKYDLIFQENVSYGYRRNTWGLKGWGVAAAALSLIVAGLLVWSAWQPAKPWQIDPKFAAAAVFDLGMLCFWLFRVTPEWVWIPAVAYAERLAEAAETIAKPEVPPGKIIVP